MVGSYPLSSQAPTHVEVELGCDNLATYRINIIMPHFKTSTFTYELNSLSITIIIIFILLLDFLGFPNPLTIPGLLLLCSGFHYLLGGLLATGNLNSQTKKNYVVGSL